MSQTNQTLKTEIRINRGENSEDIFDLAFQRYNLPFSVLWPQIIIVGADSEKSQNSQLTTTP